ncbi:hypothetical protein TorRG33x02_184740, partial [Trema orientale]
QRRKQRDTCRVSREFLKLDWSKNDTPPIVRRGLEHGCIMRHVLTCTQTKYDQTTNQSLRARVGWFVHVGSLETRAIHRKTMTFTATIYTPLLPFNYRFVPHLSSKLRTSHLHLHLHHRLPSPNSVRCFSTPSGLILTNLLLCPSPLFSSSHSG